MTAAQAVDRRDAVDAGAVAIMVALTFFWGLNQVAIKLAGEGFSPVFAMLARSVIGGLVIFGWSLARGVPLFERDGTGAAGLLVGFLFGLEFVFIFFGLDHTGAARGGLMINTMPFWILVGAHFLLHERMRPRHLIGLGMAFGGVTLIFSDKLSSPGATTLWGDVLCLAGGAAWALTTLVIKRSRLASVSAEKLLLYQLVVSTLMAPPLLPLAGPPLRDITALATGALLFQAVWIVGATYLVWFWLMQRYPAAGLASFAFLTPVFAVLCSAAILGEPATPNVIAALALIVTGLVLVNRPARR